MLFARTGLTLSHTASCGPPVPYALTAIPILSDRLFQNAAPAVAISVLSFAIAAGSVAWIVSSVADSLWPAAAAAFVLIVNPSLLYAQSTPMPEPLMLGTTLLAVAMLVAWCAADPDEADLKVRTTSTGLAFAVACLTRYEAWPVTGAALGAAIVARRQQRTRLSAAIRDVVPIAIYPAVAIAALLLVSRTVVGQWFASGSFVADNPALGHPGAAANQILTGVRALVGTLTTVIGLVGLIGLLARGLFTTSGAIALVAAAPAAAAAVPWLAFLQGHPHRARYMVPLLAAQAIGVGAAAARWRQAAPVAAVVVMLVAGLEMAPMFGASPMAAEAQWELDGFSPACDGAARRTTASEANVERHEIVEALEIDLGPGESLVGGQLACSVLVPDFSADIPRAKREAHAAENHRPDRAALADIRVAEDRRVEVDELARLGVAPPEQADTAADVRLHRRVPSEWQEAERRRERDDAQLELLLDFREVLVDEVAVDAVDRVRVDAETQAGFGVRAERHQPLAAERHAVEIVDVEREDVQIVDEHVVAAAVRARARVFARRRERAEMKVDRLLRGRGRGGGDQGKGEHSQRSTHGGTSTPSTQARPRLHRRA
jgi:hypothetical protein